MAEGAEIAETAEIAEISEIALRAQQRAEITGIPEISKIEVGAKVAIFRNVLGAVRVSALGELCLSGSDGGLYTNVDAILGIWLHTKNDTRTLKINVQFA